MPPSKLKHIDVLEAIYARPVSGTIRWSRIERLFIELGGKVQEREGSRVAVVLFGTVRVFQRPHPSPETNKTAVASIRNWLAVNGIEP